LQADDVGVFTGMLEQRRAVAADENWNARLRGGVDLGGIDMHELAVIRDGLAREQHSRDFDSFAESTFALGRRTSFDPGCDVLLRRVARTESEFETTPREPIDRRGLPRKLHDVAHVVVQDERADANAFGRSSDGGERDHGGVSRSDVIGHEHRVEAELLCTPRDGELFGCVGGANAVAESKAHAPTVLAPSRLGLVRIGLISDIHGNRIALDAVIADGRERGVEEWWVLGDLVAVGPEPVATLERLLGLAHVRFVRGNTDRYTVTGERPSPYRDDVDRDPSLQQLFDAVESSFAWTHERIADAGLLDALATLPDQQLATLADGTRVLGVHASVKSDDGPGIRPDITDAELAPLVTGADADVVLGGHTHRATDRRLDGVRAVNLGSVSNPMTADMRASYVVIDSDESGHDLAHRRVAYDHDAFIARCYASGHPQADYIAGFQRGSRGH